MTFQEAFRRKTSYFGLREGLRLKQQETILKASNNLQACSKKGMRGGEKGMHSSVIWMILGFS
jgi:hypothetical protein